MMPIQQNNIDTNRDLNNNYNGAYANTVFVVMGQQQVALILTQNDRSGRNMHFFYQNRFCAVLLMVLFHFKRINCAHVWCLTFSNST